MRLHCLQMKKTKAYYSAFALFVAANARQRDLVEIMEQINNKKEVLSPSCLRARSGGLQFKDMRSLYEYLKVPDVAVLTKQIVGNKLDLLRIRSMLAFHMGATTPTTHLNKTLRMFCMIRSVFEVA
jgi:hypothetical protein